MHAALDSMATLTSKDEEFVQVNSIETGIVILSCLSNLKLNLVIFSMVLITRYD